MPMVKAWGLVECRLYHALEDRRRGQSAEGAGGGRLFGRGGYIVREVTEEFFECPRVLRRFWGFLSSTIVS